MRHNKRVYQFFTRKIIISYYDINYKVVINDTILKKFLGFSLKLLFYSKYRTV